LRDAIVYGMFRRGAWQCGGDRGSNNLWASDIQGGHVVNTTALHVRQV